METMNTAITTPEADRLTTLDPDQAMAFELETLRRVADLALLPPHFVTNPLPEFGYDRLDYAMNLSLERTPGGRLFAVWVGGEDGPQAFMLLATSDDGGDSWSDPRLVIHGRSSGLPCPRSVIVGNLWCDPLGRLWFFFDQTMHHFDGRGGLWATRCDRPEADELVWTTPIRIWHGSVLNKPIVLSTGEWVLAAQLLESNGLGPFAQPLFPELDPLRGVILLVSTDQGANWRVRGRVATVVHPDWHEPTLVERRDASLWMLIRTGMGVVETVSTDGGRTWAPPKPHTTIRQTPSRCHLQRLASGRILLIKNGPKIDQANLDHHAGRTQLSAWLSEDEGRTWCGGLILDDRAGVSYPDGCQDPDGRIFVSYDYDRSGHAHIMLARFTEDDVMAARVVSPESELQRIIVRPRKNSKTQS
jgi:predicted neuraminidase